MKDICHKVIACPNRVALQTPNMVSSQNAILTT